MAKVPPKKRQTIDDFDLESVNALLNSFEVIEILKWYLIFGQYSRKYYMVIYGVQDKLTLFKSMFK